jgi:antitoxin (DNA-binding transcriptional repressor) of toxin-antitoxin stability system
MFPITCRRDFGRAQTLVREARSGEEVVINDRGVPVARLVGVDAAPILQRLHHEGVIDLPWSAAPKVSGRQTRHQQAAPCPSSSRHQGD